MPRESNFEKSLESKEQKDFHVEIVDIEALANKKLEAVADNTVRILLDKAKESNRAEKRFRKLYKIPEETALEVGLRQQAEKAIEEYRTHLEEKTQAFKKQAGDCYQLARKKGYLTGTRDFSVLISHEFLHRGIGHDKPMPRLDKETQEVIEAIDIDIRRVLNSFDHNTNEVIIDIDQPNKLMAHEVGHALSYDKENNRVGFNEIVEGRISKTRTSGNKWFNEGVTVMWEDLSVNDGSTLLSRDEKHDYYGWSGKAVGLIIERLGLDEDTVFKAYFGDQEARSQIDEKINEKFNCTLDDLKCLSLELNIDFIRRILDGEKVDLTIKRTTHHSVIEKMNKLSEIFPNVTIVDSREIK